MTSDWSAEARDSVPAWRRYLRLRGRDVRADVADELEFHIDMIAARRNLRPQDDARMARGRA